MKKKSLKWKKKEQRGAEAPHLLESQKAHLIGEVFVVA